MDKETNDTKTIFRRLLSEVAHDNTGAEVEKSGVPITWHEALCDQILKKSFKDGNLGWKVLQEAGVVTYEDPQKSDDDKKTERENYEKRLKILRQRFKRSLKKSGIEDPALEFQIDMAARNWLAYEKACEDFAIGLHNGDPDEKVRLSEQMRKWSNTVRDDLTKLTMNVKDSDKSMKKDEGNILKQFMAQ